MSDKPIVEIDKRKDAGFVPLFSTVTGGAIRIVTISPLTINANAEVLAAMESKEGRARWAEVLAVCEIYRTWLEGKVE